MWFAVFDIVALSALATGMVGLIRSRDDAAEVRNQRFLSVSIAVIAITLAVLNLVR